MLTDDDLDAAVAAGVIDADAVARLRGFQAARGAAAAGDEERFRLVTGFNDIFVSIALVLLLSALAWIGGTLSDSRWTGAAAVAAAAWPLAELFTARRRMALPSILLLIAFVGGLFAAVGVAGSALIGHASQQAEAIVGALAAAVAGGGAWLHWHRFHVPITVAAGAAALAGLVLMLLIGAVPGFGAHLLLPTFVAGLAIFALAMRWDVSDPARTTRRADVAFWLHLLAAPMIVHPVFALIGVTGGGNEIDSAAAAIGLYVALGLLALAIDRRALMVSALVYVLFAMASLFSRFGALSLSTALTGLVLGSALLLLSAYWAAARAAVVGLLPATWRTRLPAVHAPSAAAGPSAG